MEAVFDIENFCVSEKADIRTVLFALDKCNLGIILIIDNNKKLIGTCTDGDIRRGLLNGMQLNFNVERIMNKNFYFINEKDDLFEAEENLIQKGLRQLPVLDEKGSVIKLLVSKNLSKKKILPNSVVIMAGGIGSRLRPHTSKCPKPMLEVNGKPILEIVIENCIKCGFKEFFISVNYLKEVIFEHFKDGSKWGITIHYLEESKPLGTAGSLSLLPKNLKNHILVMNGDVLTKFNLQKLLEFHSHNNAVATLSVREYVMNVPFGVIDTDGVDVKGMTEKPSYKKNVNAGVYALDPIVLNLLNKNERLDMPELLKRLISNNYKVIACPIHEYWLDIGRPETLEEAYSSWETSI